MPNNAPFPIQPDLTAVAIGYRNKTLISDGVLPRIPVSKQEFKYLKHDMSEGFTIPDTKVGRKSAPNQISFSATEVTESTRDYGLEDPIPQADINNAPHNYDPIARSTEGLTDLILLDREKRVADLVQNYDNYATSSKVTLSGTDQFSDFVNSDPIEVIMNALDSMIMRGNIAVMGQEVFSMLCRHPKLCKAIHGNSGDVGIVNAKAIADLFNLEAFFVGAAFVNIAKKGQTATLARVWGKHFELIYRNQLADNRSGVTFGFTAQWGSRIAGANPDKNIGLRGGQILRVGESVKEVICANDLGYMIKDAVA